MAFMSLFFLTLNAQNESYDWTNVINAIIQVESRGNSKAFNPNGNCAGILQITPGLVKQCNIWLKAEKSDKRYTLEDRYDVEKSKEMFVLYQKHYNKTNNVERAIRIWNGGPGYKVPSTNGSYSNVMKYYKGDN